LHLSLSAFARPALILVAATAMVGAVACSDDEEPEATSTATTAATADATGTATAAATTAATSTAAATTEATEAAGETVEVTAVDYSFEGLPDTIEAGTTLSFTNGSTAEFHEMVVIAIPDGEERSVEELIALPPEESDAIFADVMPALVAVAAPGEAGMAVLGDGTIADAGRYAVVCFIPVGADPEVVAAAMQSATSEAPDLGDGPPHVSEGMYAELTVE
jgi:plastocyanin